MSATATAPDAASIAALRALGYLSGAGDGAPPLAGLPDPKDRVALKKALDEGEASAGRGAEEEALAIFERALRDEPTNRYALLRAAQLAVRLGRSAPARERFTALLRLSPDHGEARFEYADLLGRSGDVAAAIDQWREVTRRQPWRSVAWANLGVLLAGQGRLEEALETLERSLRLEPENATVRRNAAVVRERLRARSSVPK